MTGAVAVVLVLAGVPVYSVPAQSAPRPAEVVLVLGPPEPWRVEWARELVRNGTVGHILLSVPDPARYPACRDADVTCFVPDPFTTRGEARQLRASMAERGWTSALVITTTPHVTRSRYVIGRCVPDGVQVVGRAPEQPPWWWAYEYAYQTAGWLRAITQSGC